MANKPAQTNRITVAVMVIIMIGFSAVLSYFMHKNSTTDAQRLDSNDPDTIIDGLSALKERHDPTGIAKATALLNSEKPDVWNNAALYLGAMGKTESIPYLIKALETADDERANEISLDLTEMTGELLGERYQPWKDWWVTKYGATSQKAR